MNGFDDFDAKVTAEDVYLSEGYDYGTVDELVRQDLEYLATKRTERDESLQGGKYHGPTNVAGLTAREYWDTYNEWQDEQDRLRDEW